jgi:hypothetical protein
MTLSTRLWKLPKSTSKKQNIYNIYNNRVKLNRDIHFTCILRLLNNTCVKHNFKSVHVSNLFWNREYNSAKEICKYPSFSKVGGNYPLDLKIIWSSVLLFPPPIKLTARCNWNIVESNTNPPALFRMTKFHSNETLWYKP